MSGRKKSHFIRHAGYRLCSGVCLLRHELDAGLIYIPTVDEGLEVLNEVLVESEDQEADRRGC